MLLGILNKKSTQQYRLLLFILIRRYEYDILNQIGHYRRDMPSKVLVGLDGSQPAKKALEYAANLASKDASHLFIEDVIEEFGELIQRWEQHDIRT